MPLHFNRGFDNPSEKHDTLRLPIYGEAFALSDFSFNTSQPRALQDKPVLPFRGRGWRKQRFQFMFSKTHFFFTVSFLTTLIFLFLKRVGRTTFK